MEMSVYKYSVEQCDVPEVRRKSLGEYREYRRKCLEYLRSDSNTSVVSQIHNLAWHTAVFRTLNEARRIEPDRSVSGALWELTAVGYAHLMTLGIRKLVDKDSRADSVWNVINQAKRRPELLTREMFICYDGLPYDWEKVYRKHISSVAVRAGGHVDWIPTSGPKAWAVSEMMHKAFDRLCGHPKKRKRGDTISPSILDRLIAGLSYPAIEKICALADKRMAHAERQSESTGPSPTATYEDIDEAFQQIVRIVNFLSVSFFYDKAFGSIVPTPQFNILEGLDQPWITAEKVVELQRYWNEISEVMDNWASDQGNEFLPS